MKIGITGANGHLGLRLLSILGSEHDIVALVRSERARQKVLDLYSLTHSSLKVIVVNYTDSEQIKAALQGCEYLVHLVGIIKEGASSKYVDAHEKACQALVEALDSAQIKRLVYLSIVGADSGSSNLCLKSKGQAEQILLESSLPASVLKIPMVLGEGDFASYALRKKAHAQLAFTFRGGSLEQPIYAGDLIKAIMAILMMQDAPSTINLAGPESLARTQLIQRSAEILGGSPYVMSLPMFIAGLIGFVCECLPNPPTSRAMLGVLDHDDLLDVKAVCELLSLDLTPLDETLEKVLR